MLDATIKHIFQYTLLSACLFCSFSCGNSKQAEDSEKAEQIMSEIKSMYTGKDYDNAMLMIDSLMKTYPGLIDVQRKAMHIQTMITEKRTLADSIANEKVLEQSMAAADSIKHNLKFVKSADMVEGYFVDKTMPDDGIPSVTGIVARVAEHGDISLLSSLRGHRIRHTRICAIADTANVATGNVPLSNSRNYRYNDNGQNVELVTFNAQECGDFLSFIAQNTALPITIKFVNGSKSYKQVLSQKEKSAIKNVVNYATAITAAHDAANMRLKFARKLQLARKQIKQTATNIQGGR